MTEPSLNYFSNFSDHLCEQRLKGTDWGDLDVLILDLPPGTGDVQLAVLQQLQLSGAIAVTTPSKLATADTARGIEMFASLGVPTLAVVENMSYFEDETGRRHFPFGEGFSKHQSKFPHAESASLVQLPISVAMTDAVDSGTPLTLARPEGAEKELLAFSDLAAIVSRELLQLQYGAPPTDGEGFVVFDESDSDGEPGAVFGLATVILALDKKAKGDKFAVRLVSDSGAIQKQVAPAQLRSRDPRTGEIMPDSPYLVDQEEGDSNETPGEHPLVTKTRVAAKTGANKRSPSVIPTKVERRGRYGFAVEWGDGATIIYSMRCLAKAAGGVVKEKDTAVV